MLPPLGRHLSELIPHFVPTPAYYLLLLEPGHSECGPWTSITASFRSELDLLHLGPPGLLTQTLHFNELSRWFVCTLKFEKHCSRERSPPTHLPNERDFKLLKTVFVYPHGVCAPKYLWTRRSHMFVPKECWATSEVQPICAPTLRPGSTKIWGYSGGIRE